MRAPNDLPTDCYSALLSSLGTLAEGCPGLPPNTPSLHRLRNLVVVVQGSPPARPSAVPPSPSLAHSLSLVSATQGLLTVLRDAGAASPVAERCPSASRKPCRNWRYRWGQPYGRNRPTGLGACTSIIDPQATEGRDPWTLPTPPSGRRQDVATPAQAGGQGRDTTPGYVTAAALPGQ